MEIEIIKFILYLGLIILISKYILVTILRRFAENLNLKPKTVGNVAGVATSMPELLTVGASSFNGLMGASIINVLSSNIINFVQYLASVYLNKNKAAFQNKAIKIDISLVLFTIIIPILILFLEIEINITVIPAFVILYLLFKFLNNNSHILYLQKEEQILGNQIEKEGKWERGNRRKTIKYVIYLIITGILLFWIGNELGNTLENLCNEFKIPQFIIGVLLGFMTSIPELITFFESQKHYKKRKTSDILGVIEATNNLLTSNLFNIFVIQSIGIIIYTLTSG